METLTDISKAVLNNLEDSSKKTKGKAPTHSTPFYSGCPLKPHLFTKE